MTIMQLTVQQKRLSTAEAELWVLVQVENIDGTTQLRGCMTGPHCPGVETVQIGYALKPIRPEGCAENVLVGRIVIPEPNFWTAELPFVYEGNVELWHEGKSADVREIRAVFKKSV